MQNSYDYFVERYACTLDYVQMTISGRIKTSWINSYYHVFFSLSPA